jgi:exopolysaccharide biosynthesis WecB/TagA/CpsF family protein
METVKILNISIHNLAKGTLLENLSRSGGVVFTPNVDHLMKLRKNVELQGIYAQADYRICDSRIIQYASWFLGTPICEKISGSDLFPAFYEYNKSNEEIAIFLLGARQGVAERAREKINHKVGREIIVGTYAPTFGFEDNEEECQKIMQKIRDSGATVVAVGLGAPKQEKWIVKYKPQLEDRVKVFMGIGATIDFEAGYQPRSPKWMSQIGLEWLYRLSREPKRLWQRYLIEGMPFFGLILQQKISLLIASHKNSIKSDKINSKHT